MVEKKTPPCGTCRPEILPDNQEAVAVFRRCSGQWRLAPSGLQMGVEAPAVETVMRLMQVAEPLECFDKVLMIAEQVVKVLGKAAESKRGGK